jgi:hypothetical protein
LINARRIWQVFEKCFNIKHISLANPMVKKNYLMELYSINVDIL